MPPLTAELQLKSGHVITVDRGDLDLVEPYNWYAHERFYSVYARSSVRISGKRVAVLMHRLILNPPPDVRVDHRDNNGLNNRRANLRLCTQSQNAANRHNLTTNTSHYRGVTFHKRVGKWQAAVKVNGRNFYLGLFHDPWDAACAYNRAAQEAFGEFARLNTTNLGEIQDGAA